MWSAYFHEGDAATGKSKLWKGIDNLNDVQHGDVLSWGFQVDKTTCKVLGGHADTGHVMIITNGPGKEDKIVSIKDGWATVWVSDASNLKHVPGSNKGARYSEKSVSIKEGPGKTAGGPEHTGVGMGQVKIGVDANGKPNGKYVLQTKEGEGAQIGIGRPL